jgi:hypothetical protein
LFLGQLCLAPLVALCHHFPDQGLVGRYIREVPVASQDQGLIDVSLETVMGLFRRPILMR